MDFERLRRRNREILKAANDRLLVNPKFVDSKLGMQFILLRRSWCKLKVTKNSLVKTGKRATRYKSLYSSESIWSNKPSKLIKMLLEKMNLFSSTKFATSRSFSIYPKKGRKITMMAILVSRREVLHRDLSDHSTLFLKRLKKEPAD